MNHPRTQIDREIGCRTRQRSDVGHAGKSQAAADPSAVFDLGASGGSDIARNKDAMLSDAIASQRRKPRRR